MESNLNNAIEIKDKLNFKESKYATGRRKKIYCQSVGKKRIWNYFY